MDLTVLRRIAKARWWVLIGAAVLAVVVTGRLADYQRENVLTHEATTSVVFTEDPTKTTRSDFEDFLDGQLVLAEDANVDLLATTPGPFLPWHLAEVVLAKDRNELTFVGRGYTQLEADQTAQALSQRYLELSTIGAGQQRVSQELTDVASEIEALRKDIADRTTPAPLTEEEKQTEIQRGLLQAQITFLQTRSGELAVELLNPVLRPAAQIEAEISRVKTTLTNLELELAALSPAPNPAETQAADQTLVFDQLRLQELEARWKQLYTQSVDLEALARVSPELSRPVTVATGSKSTNQMLAAAGALIVAMLALVAIERTRGGVWSDAEIEAGVAVLAEVPPRRTHILSRPSFRPWYAEVTGGRRKAGVQLLRSELDRLQNAVITFQGSGVFAEDTLDLCADVAMSAAVAGRRVLLIDATYSNRNQVDEYGPEIGTSLTSLLNDVADDPEEAMADVKTMLLVRPEEHPGLTSLRSGPGQIEAGDVLASHRFETILEVARELFDLVILAGASFGEPTSYILAQRVDAAILVGSIGHTIDYQVEAAERDFRARRASLLGIVLVRRRPSRISRWTSPRSRKVIWSVIDRLRSTKGGDTTLEDGEAGRTGFQPILDRFRVTFQVNRARVSDEAGDEETDGDESGVS